mmetsp:Transcript_12056/g.17932  ORF Transcript_12056/g.17932 Transcript_12056/m.17932 type:complete len:806 (-) Transcript_12056:92-2509(-)
MKEKEHLIITKYKREEKKKTKQFPKKYNLPKTAVRITSHEILFTPDRKKDDHMKTTPLEIRDTTFLENMNEQKTKDIEDDAEEEKRNETPTKNVGQHEKRVTPKYLDTHPNNEQTTPTKSLVKKEITPKKKQKQNDEEEKERNQTYDSKEDALRNSLIIVNDIIEKFTNEKGEWKSTLKKFNLERKEKPVLEELEKELQGTWNLSKAKSFIKTLNEDSPLKKYIENSKNVCPYDTLRNAFNNYITPTIFNNLSVNAKAVSIILAHIWCNSTTTKKKKEMLKMKHINALMSNNHMQKIIITQKEKEKVKSTFQCIRLVIHSTMQTRNEVEQRGKEISTTQLKDLQELDVASYCKKYHVKKIVRTAQHQVHVRQKSETFKTYIREQNNPRNNPRNNDKRKKERAEKFIKEMTDTKVGRYLYSNQEIDDIVKSIRTTPFKEYKQFEKGNQMIDEDEEEKDEEEENNNDMDQTLFRVPPNHPFKGKTLDNVMKQYGGYIGIGLITRENEFIRFNTCRGSRRNKNKKSDGPILKNVPRFIQTSGWTISPKHHKEYYGFEQINLHYTRMRWNAGKIEDKLQNTYQKELSYPDQKLWKYIAKGHSNENKYCKCKSHTNNTPKIDKKGNIICNLCNNLLCEEMFVFYSGSHLFKTMQTASREVMQLAGVNNDATKYLNLKNDANFHTKTLKDMVKNNELPKRTEPKKVKAPVSAYIEFCKKNIKNIKEMENYRKAEKLFNMFQNLDEKTYNKLKEKEKQDIDKSFKDLKQLINEVKQRIDGKEEPFMTPVKTKRKRDKTKTDLDTRPTKKKRK